MVQSFTTAATGVHDVIKLYFQTSTMLNRADGERCEEGILASAAFKMPLTSDPSDLNATSQDLTPSKAVIIDVDCIVSSFK